MGYHDLETDRPNESRSLRNAYGRKDTLPKKTRCSIFIHIIFSPLIISSGFHFNMIAQFKINTVQTPWRCAQLQQSYWPKVAVRIAMIACPRPDPHPNECLFLPHRKQSPSSTYSHCEQNFCTQTRSVTVMLAPCMPRHVLWAVDLPNDRLSWRCNIEPHKITAVTGNTGSNAQSNSILY